MPDNLSDRTVQRIVVRNGLSLDLASRLLTAIDEETAYLDRLESAMPVEKHHPGFTH